MTVSISASFDREFTFVGWYQGLFSFSFKKFILKGLKTLIDKLGRNLINHIDDAILLMNGALVLVKSYDQETALRELKDISRILDKFIELDSSMAKMDHFENEELKEKINTCIACLYDIDLILRKKAYSSIPSKSNSDFVSALAMKSKIAIQSTFVN